MVLEILADINVATFIIFILILAALVIYDRRKVRLEGIIFIRRTQRGRDFIDRTARRHKRAWHALGIAGIAVAVPVLILGAAFLASQALAVGAGEGEGDVRLLLPGPVADPLSAPGIFVVPWWIWVIGIAVVIIPHEFMHGIMCRIEKIRISSVGWILLLIIPGAFVEPDEKQLRRAPRKTKLKIYAAGSFANIVTAFVVLGAMTLLFAGSFAPAGVFVNAIEGSPANASGLQGSIIDIDGEAVRSIGDIRAMLAAKQPGDIVRVTAAESNILIPRFSGGADFFIPKPAVVTDFSNVTTYEIALSERNGTAFLGVAPVYETFEYTPGFENFAAYRAVATLLIWIFIFSLGIGVVNLLPMKPLDGGLIFEELIGDVPHARRIALGVSVIMLGLLAFNLIGGALV